MANRYWVQGGDGIFSNTDNWSTTSGGSSGSSVPTTGDTAFFDANSGSYFTVQVISSVLCSIDTTDSVSLSFWVTDGGHLSLNTVIELDSLAIDGTGVFNSNSYNITANYIYIQDTASAQFGTSAITATKTLWFWGTSSGDADVTGGSFYVNYDTNVQIINTTLTNSEISGADTYYALTSDGNVDGGGNTGFVFTLSGTLRYWITDDNGDWDDTANWSVTSGGTGGVSVPLTSDYTAVFDYNSFSVSYKTVTVQGVSVACAIVNSSANPFTIHEIPNSIIGTTSISLQNNLRVYGLQLNDTFSSNDYLIHAQYFVVSEYSSGLVPIIDLGSSDISIFDISGEYVPTFSICSSVTGGTENVSIFFICRYGAYNKFESYGIGIGAVYIRVLGALDFYSDGTTFGILAIESSDTDDWDGINVMTEDAEIIIGTESGLILAGDSSTDRLLISPYNEGSTYTISMASGTCDATNCSLTGCIATGGATFNALLSNGCVDGGDNTGWNFAINDISLLLNDNVNLLDFTVLAKGTDILALINDLSVLSDSKSLNYGLTVDEDDTIELTDEFGTRREFLADTVLLSANNSLLLTQATNAETITLTDVSVIGYGYQIDLTLPTLSCEATSASTITLNVILPVLSATGKTGELIAGTFPKLSVAATSIHGAYSVGILNLPKLISTSESKFRSIGVASFNLPILVAGSIAFDLPAGALSSSLSTLRLSARATKLNLDILGICLNTEINAPSQYSGLSFDSMCVFNGKIIGAGETGILEFGGEYDVASNITSYFKLFSTDLNEVRQKRLRSIFIAGKLTGSMQVVSIFDNANCTTYNVECPATSTYVQTVVDANYNDKGNFIGLKVSNVGGSDYDIDNITALVTLLNLPPHSYRLVGRSNFALPSLEGV
jgi:hypothetical protein